GPAPEEPERAGSGPPGRCYAPAMEPRARVLAAATVRELDGAGGWIGPREAGALARSHPSRVVVVEGLGPEIADRAALVLGESGANVVRAGGRLAWSATPVVQAHLLDRLQ